MVSIRDQIIDELATTVGALPALTGGVSKSLPEDPSLSNLPKAFVLYLGETTAEYEFAFQLKHLAVEILIALVFESEGAATAGSEQMDALATLVERAIQTDVSRGGLAIDTQVDRIEINPEGPQAGFVFVTLGVLITYRHKYGDPDVAA